MIYYEVEVTLSGIQRLNLGSYENNIRFQTSTIQCRCSLANRNLATLCFLVKLRYYRWLFNPESLSLLLTVRLEILTFRTAVNAPFSSELVELLFLSTNFLKGCSSRSLIFFSTQSYSSGLISIVLRWRFMFPLLNRLKKLSQYNTVQNWLFCKQLLMHQLIIKHFPWQSKFHCKLNKKDRWQRQSEC